MPRNGEEGEPAELVCQYLDTLTEEHLKDIRDTVRSGVLNRTIFEIRNNPADGQEIIRLAEGYKRSLPERSQMRGADACIYEAFCFDRNFMKIVMSFAKDKPDRSAFPRLADISEEVSEYDLWLASFFEDEAPNLRQLMHSAETSISVTHGDGEYATAFLAHEAMAYLFVQFDRQLQAGQQ
jgi:hypothetical protein